MGSVGEDTALCPEMSVSADVSKRAKQNYKPNKKNMKTEIKFNHDADSLTKALGMKQSTEEVAMAISMAVAKWSKDSSGSLSLSILSEYLYKQLSQEAILILATQSVHDKLQEAFKDSGHLKKLMEMLESFERREYGDEIERKIREN
jgi:DNA-directed RNA polymerase specialized sigma subunit